jgi:hypothetical protein
MIQSEDKTCEVGNDQVCPIRGVVVRNASIRSETTTTSGRGIAMAFAMGTEIEVSKIEGYSTAGIDFIDVGAHGFNNSVWIHGGKIANNAVGVLCDSAYDSQQFTVGPIILESNGVNLLSDTSCGVSEIAMNDVYMEGNSAGTFASTEGVSIKNANTHLVFSGTIGGSFTSAAYGVRRQTAPTTQDDIVNAKYFTGVGVTYPATGGVIHNGSYAQSIGLAIPNSTSLPGTCTVGQIYMDTDATSGQRIYACQSTNTWALQGDGGAGGGYATIKDESTARPQQTTVAFLGAGVSCVDGTGQTECTIAGGGSANSFETMDAPAGTDPVADGASDTLAITAGTGVTITGTAASDTLDFSLDSTLSDISDGTVAENLVNTANPWAVNEGGTGAGTFTSNAVLLGNTTSAIAASVVTIASGAVDGVTTLDADGAVTATSFEADPAATPSAEFNDTVAADTNPESRIVADAVADDNGRIELQVEDNSDGTYNAGVIVQSTTGTTLVKLGAGSIAGTDFIQIGEAGVLTGEGNATIEAAALTGTVPDASVDGSAEAGEIDIDNLTGLTDIGSAWTKTTADITVSGVEVDFDAGAANAWPRLLIENSPTAGDCDAAGEAGRLLMDGDLDTDGSVMVCRGVAGWKDIDDDGGAGGFTSFNADGDNNSPQTITDGNELLIAGTAAGIDTTASATDTVTVALDLTELSSATLGAGAFTALTFDAGATDPVFTMASDSVTVTGAATFNHVDGSIPTADLATEVRSMYWGAAGISSDGTQCANAAEVTINSGPKLYTIKCADNDGSTVYGSTVMPDGWDAGTVTFELTSIQTAADTGAMNADVSAQCYGDGETVGSTWNEVALDDAAVTGSNKNDMVTSGAVTAAGTCAAGDALYWRIQLDAAGTTTAVATWNIVGVKMEYTTNIGD